MCMCWGWEERAKVPTRRHRVKVCVVCVNMCKYVRRCHWGWKSKSKFLQACDVSASVLAGSSRCMSCGSWESKLSRETNNAREVCLRAGGYVQERRRNQNELSTYQLVGISLNPMPINTLRTYTHIHTHTQHIIHTHTHTPQGSRARSKSPSKRALLGHLCLF